MTMKVDARMNTGKGPKLFVYVKGGKTAFRIAVFVTKNEGDLFIGKVARARVIKGKWCSVGGEEKHLEEHEVLVPLEEEICTAAVECWMKHEAETTAGV